jgi:hypothetical protein
MTLSQKNPSQKRGMTQGVGPEFKPQNLQKTKKEEISVVFKLPSWYFVIASQTDEDI